MKTPQSLICWAFFSFLSLSSLFISESNSIISHSTITVTNYSTIQTHTLFLSLNFSKYQIPKLFSSLSTAIAIYFFFSLFSSFCSTNSPESVRLLILLIRISSMTWHRIIQFRELWFTSIPFIIGLYNEIVYILKHIRCKCNYNYNVHYITKSHFRLKYVYLLLLNLKYNFVGTYISVFFHSQLHNRISLYNFRMESCFHQKDIFFLKKVSVTWYLVGAIIAMPWGQ